MLFLAEAKALLADMKLSHIKMNVAKIYLDAQGYKGSLQTLRNWYKENCPTIEAAREILAKTHASGFRPEFLENVKNIQGEEISTPKGSVSLPPLPIHVIANVLPIIESEHQTPSTNQAEQMAILAKAMTSANQRSNKSVIDRIEPTIAANNVQATRNK